MRGRFAAPIFHMQYLLRIRQRNDQRVLYCYCWPTRLYCDDVHALLAFTIGRRDAAVHVDDRFLEKMFRLTRPNLDSRFVDPVLQRVDLFRRIPALVNSPMAGTE